MASRAIFACLLLCWSAGSAYPATGDLCFHYGNLLPVIVARGGVQTLPKQPDGCATLPLFESSPSREGAGIATICRGTGGKHILFQYTYSGCLGPDSYVEIGTCRLLSAPGGPGVPAEGACRGFANHGPLGTDKETVHFLDTGHLEECPDPPWAVVDGFDCSQTTGGH
jgi:hypothetical protein